MRTGGLSERRIKLAQALYLKLILLDLQMCLACLGLINVSERCLSLISGSALWVGLYSS